MKNLIILFALIFYSISSFSCKDVNYSEKYLVDDFSPFSNIITAKIITSTYNADFRYKSLISFEAIVISKIKGNLSVNQKITVSAKQESPAAVCPLHFKDGETYLLLLETIDGQLYISRFSFPVSSKSEYFSGYIRQINSTKNHK